MLENQECKSKNERRWADSLDGLWTFVREQSNSDDVGIRNEWYKKDLKTFKAVIVRQDKQRLKEEKCRHWVGHNRILALLQNATVMPVPAAYNDMSADAELRDHVGWVWYQTMVFIPETDKGQHLALRFGSANYFAKVV
ncbi:unnamed protein product, partial [Strongylus vulgaris]